MQAFLHEEVLRDQLSMACVGKEKCDRRKSKRLPKTSEFPAHLLDVALKVCSGLKRDGSFRREREKAGERASRARCEAVFCFFFLNGSCKFKGSH